MIELNCIKCGTQAALSLYLKNFNDNETQINVIHQLQIDNNKSFVFKFYLMRHVYRSQKYHFWCSSLIRFAFEQKQTKLTKVIRGDSQRKTPVRRTSTVPEENKPPSTRWNEPAANDTTTTTITTNTNITTNTMTPIEQSSNNGSPDSILSGPLEEGANSTPDTTESVAPTAPFPPISSDISSFGTLEPARDRKSSRSGSGNGRKNASRGKDEQRAFGSPVSIDVEDGHF